MKRHRSLLTDEEKRKKRQKETERRRYLRKLKKEKQAESTEKSLTAYSRASSLARAVSKVDKVMPNSPGKKRAVVKQLVCKVKLDFFGKKLQKKQGEKKKIWGNSNPKKGLNTKKKNVGDGVGKHEGGDKQ